ncbi:MAG: DUF2163 domain-containing protein [Devosia sp.]
MRPISQSMQAHLDATVTTMCRCWRLERVDGVVMGFTDHDREVVIDEDRYSALSGFASTGDVTKAGLSVGGLEIEGALASDALTAEDLEDGRYDGAKMDLWLVNWMTGQRVHLRSGTLGEVTRADGAFRAEVRGPMQALEAVRGRLFTRKCDADLGDARCQVDVGAMTVGAVVVALDDQHVTVSGLDGYDEGHFSAGVLVVASGARAGSRRAIVRHSLVGAAVVLTLRGEILGLEAGDALTVMPGCDKCFETCRDKFSNHLNFQGFPHIPGEDRAFTYVRPGT